MKERIYIIHVKEVYDRPVRVKAESEKEALKKVREGLGKNTAIHYSYVLDWGIEETR